MTNPRAVAVVDAASAHGWMAIALDLLWDEFDRDGARAMLTNDGARATCLQRVTALAREAGGGSPLAGSVGDNLFMGIIALRLKFDRETSIAKLARNVQMRTDHDSRAG